MWVYILFVVYFDVFLGGLSVAKYNQIKVYDISKLLPTTHDVSHGSDLESYDVERFSRSAVPTDYAKMMAQKRNDT